MIERECINCEHWETTDSLTGMCPEMLATLQFEPKTLAHGSMYVRTGVHAGCSKFVASVEAQTEDAEAVAYWRDLRAEAGDSHPASLGR